MKTKKYSPFLAPNDKIDLDDIQYPLLASTKLDGFRCIFYKGEILTRSLKQVQNKQLREKFEEIRKYSEENNLILDGEIYSHEFTFQQLNRFFMTQDLESPKSVKKYGEVLQIPDSVKFYMFDCVKDDNFDEPFEKRIGNLIDVQIKFDDVVVIVDQWDVDSKEDVETNFEVALSQGFEGLILKSIRGRYKCGRGTVKEGLIFKVKPFQTFDAVILGIEQATKVDPNAERKINELGRSVTSKKKDDRICIDKASTFQVEYEGKFVYPVLAMTDIEKKEVWENQEDYIGRTFEYKGMLVGAKSVPRHPVFVRFREDKDQ